MKLKLILIALFVISFQNNYAQESKSEKPVDSVKVKMAALEAQKAEDKKQVEKQLKEDKKALKEQKNAEREQKKLEKEQKKLEKEQKN
jgi:hypothetical protein